MQQERDCKINTEIWKAFWGKALAAVNANVEMPIDPMSIRTQSLIEDFAPKEAAKEATRIITQTNKSKQKSV